MLIILYQNNYNFRVYFIIIIYMNDIFWFLMSSEEIIKISTKDIIFYFLIAILIISIIVILAIFSNKPKKNVKLTKTKKIFYDYTEMQIDNDFKVYFSKNYKKVQKQIIEDQNE